MSLCYRESVIRDGACVPATEPGQASGVVSNAEQQARMSLPSVSELDEPEASLSPWGAGATPNFMAEIMAEEEARRVARGENWLDRPKEGFPTGRAWAEARKAALDATLRTARARAERLRAAYSEHYHDLTDADVVGRLMHREGSDVHTHLYAASDAHTRAVELLGEARFHNDLHPDWLDYRVMRSKAEGALSAALRELDAGERLLGTATGAAQDRAEGCVDTLAAVEALSKTTVGAGLAVATGGQGLFIQGMAGALFNGTWEKAKQESELAHLGREPTAEDRQRSQQKVDAAAAFGALGAILPGSDAGPVKDAAVAGAKGAVLGTAQTATRNAIDDKELGHGLGGAGLKASGRGVMGHFIKGALKN